VRGAHREAVSADTDRAEGVYSLVFHTKVPLRLM